MVPLLILFQLLYYTTYTSAGADSFVVLYTAFAECEEDGKTIEYSNGIPIVTSNKYINMYIYGINITDDMIVGFTSIEDCQDILPLNVQVVEDHVAQISFTTPSSTSGSFSLTRYYMCIKENEGNWTFLDDSSIGFMVMEPLFTPPILFTILLLSYLLSSLNSGLNIGLFTLGTDELELLKEAGTVKEKKYAKKILPVRKSGNFLLCSILITATLCNSVSTVVTNIFCSGWVTVLWSTMIIVLLCEILPQSLCTTYPLAIGAKTIYVTRAFMLLTAPIAYPLGMVLDHLFRRGDYLGTYNKERLQELLELTQLATYEAKIISGTLKLGNITVEEIMTELNDMFKLPITAVLDFETIASILASGFSRIPIYVDKPSNIQYILLTKDLAVLDPEDKVPVKVVVQNVKVKCQYISKKTTVDKLLEKFKNGRIHMVFVIEERDSASSDEGLKKGNEKVIGLVTFEDVIEEIFQMEINDETDIFSDNRIKNKLETDYDLAKFLGKPSKASKPAANLSLAVFNFLSGLDTFSSTNISPKVLKSLLNQDIYYTAAGQRLPQDIIYIQGVPADDFVMILEGEMEVKIGKEGLVFNAGSFQYFGLDALKLKGTFTPDYTLQAIKKTTYIRINKVLYEAAVLATQYESSKNTPKISVTSTLYKYYRLLTE